MKSNEDKLKPCPYCQGKITDHSYDRGIVFKCKKCDYYKNYPGLLQLKISPVPIPYSDGKGGIIDPKDVRGFQEYYHVSANEDAINEFNKWVYTENIQKHREEKLNDILT